MSTLKTKEAKQKKLPKAGEVNELMSISRTSNAVLNIIFFLVAACFVLPVLLVIVVSFTPERSITLQGYQYLPRQMSDYIFQLNLTKANSTDAYTMSDGSTVVLTDGTLQASPSANAALNVSFETADWEMRTAYLPGEATDNLIFTVEVRNDGSEKAAYTAVLNGGAEPRELGSTSVDAGKTGKISCKLSMADIMHLSPAGDAAYEGGELTDAQVQGAIRALSMSLTSDKAGAFTLTTYTASLERERWLTLYNYEYLFKQPEIVGRAYINTILVTLFGTVLSVLTIALYAYPLSRHDFPYRKFFTIYMFITMVFNGGLVPYYITVSNVLSINDTIWCLILPLLFNSFWCIVMRTFYQQSVPEALIESARLDGASEIRTFFQIVAPISLPGLATIALFMFVTYWNDFYQAMLFLNAKKDQLQTMQYLCYRALSSAQFLRTQAGALGLLTADQLRAIPDEGYRMAIAVVTMGPILIVYPFFQKYFIAGLTVGAVKG